MASRGSGDFSAVARVLFDSAAKSGIVSNESRKQFAKQLQKLAGQSKKQGGSLDGVSARMSQLVARETPRGVWKRPYGQRVDARGVPPLEIPLPTKAGHPPEASPAGTADHTAMESTHHEAIERLTLKLSIPGLVRKRPTPLTPPAPSRSPQTSTGGVQPSPSPPPRVPTAAPSTSPHVASHTATPILTPVPPPAAVEEGRGASQLTDPQPRRAFVAVEAEDTDIFKSLKTPEQRGDTIDETEPAPARVVQKPTILVAPNVAQAAGGSTPKKTPPRLFVPPTTPPISTEATLAPSIPSFEGGASATSSSFSSVSVDEWEFQREQEINQLQAAQREHDERIAAEAEQERHRVLGEEWAEARKNITERFRSDDPYLAFNEKLYFSASWEGALSAFYDMSQLAKTAGPTQQLPEYAVHTLLQRMRPVARSSQHDMLKQVQEQLKALPNGATLAQIVELRLNPPSTTITDENTPQPVKPRSPIAQFATEFREAMAEAQWERAMELYDKAVAGGTSVQRRRGVTLLERIAATVIATSAIGKTKKKELGRFLAHAARQKAHGQVLDRPTSFVLARLAGGGFARSILPPLESQEADEDVLARHIDASSADDLAKVVEEAMRLGYNLRDPLVVAALGRRAIFSPDPMKVYAMIQEQTTDHVALNRTHVTLAVRALSSIRTKEAAAATCKVLDSVEHYNRRQVLCKVLPVLFELELMDEILKLYEANREAIDFPRELPIPTLFVNSALKSKQLAPLSDGDASSLPPRRPKEDVERAGTTSGAASGSSGPRRGDDSGSNVAAHSLEHIVSTDTMLDYAKERNWQAAMSVLSRLPPKIHGSQTSTATLLFNCALSAATDAPELVETIFGQMQARDDVPLNATTYNTAMSAFAKSPDQWGRAMEMYQSMPVAQRDASTYSVLLSLLAKHAQWEQAIDAWNEMKAVPALSKPSPVTYGLGILATHKYSWSATLSLYQELLKTHGYTSVKEVVTLRVLRSLEDNKRFAEVQKLEVQIEKAKSKTKKKRPQ